MLVVDDNPGYRRLVRLALEGDPTFEVVAEAATAAEAMAAAERTQPDMILVDVLLPGSQGFQLPAALAAVAPGCLVVLTSAHPDGDLDALRQLGRVAVLAKSVPPARLGRQLQALVAAAHSDAEPLHHAEVQLPASTDSPRAARRFVERTLHGWGCDELIDRVTLLVSELVGNAVLHAGSPVDLSFRVAAGCLRVEVADRSTLVPHRRQASDDDLSGRGSGVVELMADAWGITGQPDGKSVWFEMAVPAEAPR